jgi:hypothetical protein
MNNQKPGPPPDIKRSRRDRLHQLVFAGAVLGTTLLTFGGRDPKLPPYRGE